MTGLSLKRMRTAQTRLPGELVRPHEVHFKLHEAELPLKNKVQLLWPFLQHHASLMPLPCGTPIFHAECILLTVGCIF